MKEIKTKDVQKLLDFLVKEKKLSNKKAWDVIYYLQETMYIIPDKFEQCNGCGNIFNRDEEGEVLPINFKEFADFGLSKSDFPALSKKHCGKKYCNGCLDRAMYGRKMK